MTQLRLVKGDSKFQVHEQDVSFQQKIPSLFFLGWGRVPTKKSHVFFPHFIKTSCCSYMVNYMGYLKSNPWQSDLDFPGRLYGLGVAQGRLFSQGIEARSRVGKGESWR